MIYFVTFDVELKEPLECDGKAVRHFMKVVGVRAPNPTEIMRIAEPLAFESYDHEAGKVVTDSGTIIEAQVKLSAKADTDVQIGDDDDGATPGVWYETGRIFYNRNAKRWWQFWKKGDIGYPDFPPPANS